MSDFSGSDIQIGNGARYRVAFVNTHPIQYFAPLYAYLQADAGIDVTALYLSDFSIRGGVDPGFKQPVTWDLDLLAGYTAAFMGAKAKSRRIGGFFSIVAPELWTAIREGAFDAVVIHGHNLAAHHIALAACLASGTPAFARAETHLRLTRPSWKEAIRKPLLRLWYKGFSAFLAIGSANARYYQDMGVSPDKIFRVPYAVDNKRFIQASRLNAGDRVAVRERLGITGTAPAILFAAKFDYRKRPMDVIEAVGLLQTEGIDTQLVMVGSGELETALKARVTALGVKGVSFPGFVNQGELPSVYGACDLFVLPSENEPWGLTVNEAMCARLPIILSEEIGCVDDLVADSVNGGVFEAGDPKRLANAMRPFLVNPGHRERAAEASLDRIRRWSYAECGIGLRAAIEMIQTSAQRV